MFNACLKIRAFLKPLWLRLHQADVTWNQIPEPPQILSTALCRHNVLFIKRLFEQCDIEGWKPKNGKVLVSGMSKIPDYCRKAEFADHCWLEHSSGVWLDISADQFGLPEVIISDKKSTQFKYFQETTGRPPLGSLKRTILNWEGAMTGTWPDADLDKQRTLYQTLVRNVKTNK